MLSNLTGCTVGASAPAGAGMSVVGGPVTGRARRLWEFTASDAKQHYVRPTILNGPSGFPPVNLERRS